MAKIGTIFLNFLQFVFFLFSAKFLCLLFCEHLNTLLAEGNFSLDLYVLEVLKNLVTFSKFFSESCF